MMGGKTLQATWQELRETLRKDEAVNDDKGKDDNSNGLDNSENGGKGAKGLTRLELERLEGEGFGEGGDGGGLNTGRSSVFLSQQTPENNDILDEGS